jgi:hypothetical protein
MVLKAAMALAKTKAVIQKRVPQPSHTPQVMTVSSVNLALDLMTDSRQELVVQGLIEVVSKAFPIV